MKTNFSSENLIVSGSNSAKAKFGKFAFENSMYNTLIFKILIFLVKSIFKLSVILFCGKNLLLV